MLFDISSADRLESFPNHYLPWKTTYTNNASFGNAQNTTLIFFRFSASSKDWTPSMILYRMDIAGTVQTYRVNIQRKDARQIPREYADEWAIQANSDFLWMKTKRDTGHGYVGKRSIDNRDKWQ